MDGLSSPQDSGYFGAPFTATNNSLGALGGGLGEEYGPMNADIRNSAAISGTWNIGYFHGDNKIVEEVVNGWQISPILILHSGGVFSVTTGANKSFDSTNASAPGLCCPQVNPVLNPHRCRVCTPASGSNEVSAWFNNIAPTSAGASFINNGPGVAGGIGPGGADGNVGRNSLFGPGFKDLDMGVFRNINFERGIVFQLRGESTNLLNWVNLSNPTASLASRQLRQDHLGDRHPAPHPGGRPADLLDLLLHFPLCARSKMSGRNFVRHISMHLVTHPGAQLDSPRRKSIESGKTIPAFTTST